LSFLQLVKLFVFIFNGFEFNDAKNDLRAPFLCTFLEYLVILISISDFSVHVSDQIFDHNAPKNAFLLANKVTFCLRKLETINKSKNE
jgi:hypothetical protein